MDAIVYTDPLDNAVDSMIAVFIKHIQHLIQDNLNEDQMVDMVYDAIVASGKHVDISMTVVANRVRDVMQYRRKLQALLNTPQVEQRSDEWYEMRRSRLTASAIAQAIGKGKFGTKSSLLKSKAFPELDAPFDSYGVPPLRHGIILEDMTARCYSQRLGDIRIHNFGMIPHPTMSCFGASPDGINDLGIMVEIKTPYKRKVGKEIPQEYVLQMQGQMAVCDLYECDFVDAEIKMSVNIDTYMASVDPESKVDHGMIVEYCDAEGKKLFEYSPPYLTPKECLVWANKVKHELIALHGPNNVKLLQAWQLEKIHIERLKFDRDLWAELVPKIESFWSEVMETRIQGIEKIPVVSTCKKPSRTLKLALASDAEDSQSQPTNVAFIDSDSDD